MALFRALPLVAVCVAQAQTNIVNVDWSTTLHPLKTVAGFQTVVNPLTSRESPIHDAVYASIAALGAEYQRYVPWLPYPKMGIAALEPPSGSALCGFVNSGGPGNYWNATIDCGGRGAGVISAVTFASYGKPSGFCGSLARDAQCDAATSTSVVEALCVGKPSCVVPSNDETFGRPCAGATNLAIEVTCSAGAGKNFTYWDFTLPDQGMEDFLTAANSSGRTTIPNFSTIPAWLFAGPRILYPDDPLGETWNYEGPEGNTFRDPSLTALGDYYGRLLAHYTEGGFTDEGGVWVPGFNYTISHWEVLNEIESEHHMSPATYTQVYDAIVAGIRRWAPRGSARMKFVGLALESDELSYVDFFLNASNHAPGTPLDMISFHFYAQPSVRDGGANASAFEQMFSSAGGWLNTVQNIVDARDAINPSVLLDADEVGVILPDDNDAVWTSAVPGFPNVYWNAAAAMYAFLYGATSVIGLDVLGESQLVGYPSFNFSRAPPVGLWTAPPQYPSVAMVNWTDGTGTARYWALKLISDNMRPGPPAGSFAAADADVLVSTAVTGGNVSLENPFCGEILNLDTLGLFCGDAGATISSIEFASYGTPTGACGSWAVGPCNAANSTAIVSSYCLGKHSCEVPATTPIFGDPCLNVVKNLVVQATCSTGGGAQAAPAAVFAQAYVENDGSGARKLLLVSQSHAPQAVTVPGATGGSWLYIDESTAFGPAVSVAVASDTLELAPYALGLLRMPAA